MVKFIDLAGQKEMQIASLVNDAIMNADGIFVMFAVDNEGSFRNVENHITKISRQDSDAVIAVVGNKADKDVKGRKGIVRNEVFESVYTKKYDDFILRRISAKRGDGVTDLLEDMVRAIRKKRVAVAAQVATTKSAGCCTVV